MTDDRLQSLFPESEPIDPLPLLVVSPLVPLAAEYAAWFAQRRDTFGGTSHIFLANSGDVSLALMLSWGNRHIFQVGPETQPYAVGQRLFTPNLSIDDAIPQQVAERYVRWFGCADVDRAYVLPLGEDGVRLVWRERDYTDEVTADAALDDAPEDVIKRAHALCALRC